MLLMDVLYFVCLFFSVKKRVGNVPTARQIEKEYGPVPSIKFGGVSNTEEVGPMSERTGKRG